MYKKQHNYEYPLCIFSLPRISLFIMLCFMNKLNFWARWMPRYLVYPLTLSVYIYIYNTYIYIYVYIYVCTSQGRCSPACLYRNLNWSRFRRKYKLNNPNPEGWKRIQRFWFSFCLQRFVANIMLYHCICDNPNPAGIEANLNLPGPGGYFDHLVFFTFFIHTKCR